MALLASRLASAFIFVSSPTYDGNLAGIAGADDICNDLAISAGLPGEYKAWLATNADDDPNSTFFRAPGAYILPNGDIVAKDWADLTGPKLAVPINVDEIGSPHGLEETRLVWTNVKSTGEFFFDDPLTQCRGFTSAEASGVTAVTGNNQINLGGPQGWSGYIKVKCANSNRLYCVGQ